MAVEDSPNGVLSAYRAGCKVLWYRDQTQPDAELKSVYMPVSRLWQRSATSFRGGFLHVSAYALDFLYIAVLLFLND